MNVHVDRLVIGLVAFAMLESPSPAPLVPPILDDRRYDDLVAETVARIPTHTPEWTNYKQGDPGFRLLDFFALLDPPVLDDLLAEDHMRPFWNTLPFEGEEYRGQFAYTWLDAALNVGRGSGQRAIADLAHRPRHRPGLDVWRAARGRKGAGASGCRTVGQRRDAVCESLAAAQETGGLKSRAKAQMRKEFARKNGWRCSIYTTSPGEPTVETP